MVIRGTRSTITRLSRLTDERDIIQTQHSLGWLKRLPSPQGQTEVYKEKMCAIIYTTDYGNIAEDNCFYITHASDIFNIRLTPMWRLHSLSPQNTLG